MSQYIYPVNLTEDEDGRWLVEFPDLPFCVTDGATMAEALFEASDALSEALATLMTRGEDIPAPSRPAKGQKTVAPSARIAAKAALYSACRAQGLTKVDLAARLNRDESIARRLLNPKHQTKLDQLEAALAAVDQELIITTRNRPNSAIATEPGAGVNGWVVATEGRCNVEWRSTEKGGFTKEEALATARRLSRSSGLDMQVSNGWEIIVLNRKGEIIVRSRGAAHDPEEKQKTQSHAA